MLDRLSGKILHIDFGDCFEVGGGFFEHIMLKWMFLSETDDPC